MTAPIRSTVPIFDDVVMPNGTKTSPASGGVYGGTGPWVDVRDKNGGTLAWMVRNFASAPGVQGQFTIQISDSPSSGNVADLWSGGGDTGSGSETTGVCELPATASYVRMLAYGNTTNAVVFHCNLFAKA